nr:MAG TPA: hypothetical protein [Caudoviricetes sp.]
MKTKKNRMSTEKISIHAVLKLVRVARLELTAS